MLDAVGAASLEDLFADIPPDLRSGPLNLPAALSEFEVMERLRGMASASAREPVSFLGGGAYDHYVPAAVDALAGRAEFYTAYTPYQPECSQGTLQALYEYQTAICRLTGLDVANASLYDGGTALAEALLMALRVTRRSRVVLDGALPPAYLEIVRTYLGARSCEVQVVAPLGCSSDAAGLASRLDGTAAAVAAAVPNFFGSVADFGAVTEKARSLGALSVASCRPLALGLFRPPGEAGFDVACGEGQSLGSRLNFGGPYLGFLAARRGHVRALPGRIAGATVDGEGRRGFVLTLQAREQHIRRQRATSNICTNQGLCALRALIYLCCLGARGFERLARLNYDRAHYAAAIWGEIPGVEVANRDPFFNEFVLRLPGPAEAVAGRLLRRGIAAGIPLGALDPGRDRELLVAVTETASRAAIERCRDALAEAVR